MPTLSVRTPEAGVPVRAVALVLHGGRETSTEPALERHLAVLRMRPIAAALVRAGQRSGLAVARLRYSVRGWNGELRSPIGDARAALAALTRRFPGAALALVGHSMGARVALHVADDPAVRTVVGLAPWITPEEPLATLGGRRLLVVHGEQDRVTDPRASCRYCLAAAAVAQSASWVGVRGERHAMLRRPRLWHELATGFVLATVLDDQSAPDDQSGRIAGRRAQRFVRLALAGEPRFIV